MVGEKDTETTRGKKKKKITRGEGQAENKAEKKASPVGFAADNGPRKKRGCHRSEVREINPQPGGERPGSKDAILVRQCWSWVSLTVGEKKKIFP